MCCVLADLLLLCSVTRDLVDTQGSVYWLTTAANAVFQHPFPRFQQNFAVFGHLFQQCFEQRATDAAISICLLLEKHIVQYKGEQAVELRHELAARMCPFRFQFTMSWCVVPCSQFCSNSISSAIFEEGACMLHSLRLMHPFSCIHYAVCRMTPDRPCITQFAV